MKTFCNDRRKIRPKFSSESAKVIPRFNVISLSQRRGGPRDSCHTQSSNALYIKLNAECCQQVTDVGRLFTSMHSRRQVMTTQTDDYRLFEYMCTVGILV